MRLYLKYATQAVIIIFICTSIWYILDSQPAEHIVHGRDKASSSSAQLQFTSSSKIQRTSRRTSPTKNVVFLKVHKVGGSTLMNLFYRYADSKNLNLMVPIDTEGDHWNYLGFNTTLHPKNIVPLPRGESYNILCNHVLYDKQAFLKIMPNDSVYITILRNPVGQFVSAAMYYNFLSSLEQEARKHIGLQPIPELFHEYFTNRDRYSSVNSYHVRNKMSHDLGLPMSRFDDKVFIERFIQNLTRDYELVMMMEYFTESVILMRRFLLWTLEDVIFIPLNVNMRKKKKNVMMYNDDIDALSEWNYADFQLYKHFEQRYMQQIEAEGPSLQQEVTYFNDVLEKIAAFCASDKELYAVTESEWSKAFDVSKEQCKMMTSDAIPVIKTAIRKSRKRFNTWAMSNDVQVLT
ncbi:galactose-3-O-sulfotransferase 2-like [Mizuhopecten yessoensis]|nr:galactose-3-O-sulfotransferase 2-like [Mizuhopecten yessoensis]XP_021350436.1 galactose-3-O-sulfotransferase 2-like [Mizuhopecten yessoensis]